MTVTVSIEAVPNQWNTSTIHVATLSADGYSYKIQATYEERLKDAVEVAARPSAVTDGAVVRAAYRSHYDGEREGAPWVYEWFLRPLSAPEGSEVQVGSYYRAESFGEEGPIQTPVEPRFMIVAVEETRNWADPVVQALGRIKGVYVYDEAQHTHLAEFTPSHWLQFSRNDCERLFEDENEEREVIKPLGYDFFTEFEMEGGDEHGMYMHCHSVDRIGTRIAAGLPWDYWDEYMLEDDEEARQKMHQDTLDELCRDTHGFEPFPEGRKYQAPEQSPSPAP